MPQENNAAGYASPLKRVWAWVGVVYMVILVLLVTFFYATGHFLTGIGGVMVAPALAGAAVSCVVLWRTGARREPWQKVLMVGIILACAVLMIDGLVRGIPALLAGLRGGL